MSELPIFARVATPSDVGCLTSESPRHHHFLRMGGIVEILGSLTRDDLAQAGYSYSEAGIKVAGGAKLIRYGAYTGWFWGVDLCPLRPLEQLAYAAALADGAVEDPIQEE